MLKKIRFVGHPHIFLKSLNRQVQHGETVDLREEDITPEIRGLLKMGLFEYVSNKLKGASFSRGTDFFRGVFNRNDKRRDTAQKQEPEATAGPSSNEALLTAIRDIVREEIKSAPISPAVSRASNSVSRPSKEQIKENTLFIRPEESNIQGSIEVKSQSEESEDLNAAVNKLKKKGPKNK